MIDQARVFATAAPGEPLERKVEDLLLQQRQTWAWFKDNEATLAQIKQTPLGEGLMAQFNPERAASVNANTDKKAIKKRPCFLCENNMPPEEKGIAYDQCMIWPNPMPVLKHHLTIASMIHEPQIFMHKAELFVSLMKDLGEQYAVFYNGARCGASAPDHQHFQAGYVCDLPLFARDLSLFDEGVHVIREPVFVLYLKLANTKTLLASLDDIFKALGGIGATEDEPMANVVGVYRDGYYSVFVFPRFKHRPECFFAEGDEALRVSPAALEMCGLLVVADEHSYNKLKGKSALSILQEVSLGLELQNQLIKKLDHAD